MTRGEGQLSGAEQGGVDTQRRRDDLDHRPRGGEHPAPQTVLHRVSEQRVQAAVHPAEDDQLGVEQVDQVGNADPQPATDGVDGGAHLGISALGEGDDVIDRHPTPGPDGWAGEAQQGSFAGFGLPTAGRPAPATDSSRIDQGVTGLAGVSGGTESGSAAEDHTDPDPHLAGHEQEVGDAR